MKKYEHFHQQLKQKIILNKFQSIFQKKMNKKFLQMKDSNQNLILYIQSVMLYFQQTFNQMSMKFVEFVTLLQPIKNNQKFREPEVDPRGRIERIKMKKQKQKNGKHMSDKKLNLPQNEKGIKNNFKNDYKNNNTSSYEEIKASNQTINNQITNPFDDMYSFPLNQEDFQREEPPKKDNMFDESIERSKYLRNYDFSATEKQQFKIFERQDIKKRNTDLKLQEIGKSIDQKWSKMGFSERLSQIQKLKQKRQALQMKQISKKISQQESKTMIDEKFNNLLSRKHKKQVAKELIDIQDDQIAKEHQKIDIKDLRQAIINPQKMVTNPTANKGSSYLSDYADFDFDEF